MRGIGVPQHYTIQNGAKVLHIASNHRLASIAWP